MSKKWMLVVGGVIVVAAALVGGQMLLSRNSSAPNPAGPSSVATATSGSASASGSPSATSGSSSSYTATAGILPPKGGKSTGSANATLQPFPAMPAPKLPARKVTEPVAAGQPLAPLSDAPGITISALKLGTMPNGSAYAIRMRPYGIGPSSSLGSRLVIRVDSAKPIGKAPANSKIVRANVIALVDTRHGGTVTKGGVYSATLAFHSDGTKLLPVISQVRAVK